MMHSTRPGNYLYLVPDVTTGKETFITFVIIVEIALIGGVIIIVVRRRTAPNRQLQKDVQAHNRARVERFWQKRRPKQEDESSIWKRPG